MNSFLQGKKTLTVPPLRPLAAPAHAAIASPKPHATTPAAPACEGSTPSVEVVKEGDKVVRLIVHCTCGERVEIDCLYPGG